MNVLLLLLIVAANPDAPMAGREPDAVVLFQCDFGESWDTNFDQWPDGWVRQRGVGFPNYVKIQIANDPAAPKNHCLRIDLDGGGGALDSPEIEIGSGFSFLLEGRIQIEGLKNDRAFLSLKLLDEKHHEIETIYSPRMVEAKGWTKIQVGPLTPSRADVRYAIVGLHVEVPPAGGRLNGAPPPDWKGTVCFGNLVLSRLPQMVLRSNHAANIYPLGATPEFICRVTGFPSQVPTVRFELSDIHEQVLKNEELKFVADDKATERPTPGSKGTRENPTAGFHGEVRWKLTGLEPGFYHVRAQIADQATRLQERKTTLVVLPPDVRPKSGEFGWTLPWGDEPLALGPLSDLLEQAGVHWVKFPVWSAGRDNQRADRLVWFYERLNFLGIQMVGLLLEPPAEKSKDEKNIAGPSPPNRERTNTPGAMSRLDLTASGPAVAADVFTENSQTWYPSLEPVLTRLSLKVRWWQLGQDRDTSFVGYPELPAKMTKLKQQLQRFNQELHIGFGWPWMNEVPDVTPAPWSFLSLSANPPLTAEEMAAYLSAEHKDPARKDRVKRWVVIEPLARNNYSLTTRVQDMMHRMIAAKIQHADAIFNPQPFDDERGLMNVNGTPSELFLPWRTVCNALAGAEYLGMIDLPNGSPNHLFTRNGETTMIVWNERPMQEKLFLGDAITHIDPFGHVTHPALEGDQQVIDVGPLPTIVTGLSEPIARWRMSFAFASLQMPSIIGKPINNPLTFHNYFPQGVSGEVKLNLPEGWKTRDDKQMFKVAANERANLPLQVSLPFDASSGQQAVRIDFDINAAKNYKFSVYRTLELGEGDVDIKLTTHLTEHGDLDVEQQFLNRTNKPVNFKCQLNVPGRIRRVSHIVDQQQGRDAKHYRLPNGRELLGRTLRLRAEEVGSERVLNYYVVATE